MHVVTTEDARRYSVSENEGWKSVYPAEKGDVWPWKENMKENPGSVVG